MLRWLVVPILVALLGCSAAEAESLPGQMLFSGSQIDLYVPATGEMRHVAEEGEEGVLFPHGRELAYIREVGCFPTGENSCYTEYSVFEKAVDEEAAVPGRQTFGPTDWFVRGVDVSRGGRLVFSAKPGPGPPPGWEREMEIYSANLDGSGVRQLTHNRAFDNDPAVSPDGRRVAFSRLVHGRGQIFTMRIDGSHEVRVTHDRNRNRLPAWSANGRRLLYLSQAVKRPRPFPDRELFAVAASGGKGHRLTHNKTPEEAADYSPDGRWIAYLAGGAVWAMGADGKSPHKILSSGFIRGYSNLDWGPVP
jgi:WD40-like Beta Propeller Repeat